MADLKALKSRELLSLHGKIIDELRERGVVRSSNNPTGDLAEHLCCLAFGWERTAKSNPAVDAADKNGMLYQIKGRRLTRHNSSRQAGALRGLQDGKFHYLAGVLFDADYNVLKGVLLPHAVVLQAATFIEHTNSWKFFLRDSVWALPDAQDITEALRAVEL